MEFYEHTQILQAAILSNPTIMDHIVVGCKPEDVAQKILAMALDNSVYIQLHWEKMSGDAIKKMAKEKFQKLKKQENEDQKNP